MKLFNRFFTSVSATVEKAVSQVENHEAVVEAALRDTRTAAAKARVRYARVKKDGQQLHNKLLELFKQEQTWSDRAKQVAGVDEDKALACIQRRNHCREQLSRTQDAIKSHEGLEANVASSIEHIEKRLEELTQQRNMMRSRHSAADAMRIISQIENDAGTSVDDALDRWDMVITEAEYFTGSVTESDSLDESFNKTENRDALRKELAALLAEKDSAEVIGKESNHEH